MPCRCCNNRCTSNNSGSFAVGSTNSMNNGSDRCSGSSFWPEFANPPRNLSQNGQMDLSGCCSRCSRR